MRVEGNKSVRAALVLVVAASIRGASAQCSDVSQDVRCMFQTDIQAEMGSYNSLMYQTAFCKMQGFDTESRETSGGPSIFTSGLVRIGVGLAYAQFGSQANKNWLDLTEGAATCGMCIEVLRADNVPELSHDLTNWDYQKNISLPFIAMVFDQCTDPICDHQGYLDFDVYNQTQPVAYGNPRILEWRAVECPVGQAHKLEYLFCTIGTCNHQDTENVPVWGDAWHSDFFSIIVRNQRIPIIQVELFDPAKGEYRELHFLTGLGWLWDQYAFEHETATSFKIRVTSADGQVLEEEIPKGDILDGASEPGYRGGLLIRGKKQFGPAHF